MLKYKKQKIFKSFIIILLLISFFFVGLFLGNNNFEKNNQKEVLHSERNLQEILTLWKKIDEKFVDTRKDQSEEITEQEHIWGAMRGLVSSFQDPYTIFLPPNDNQYLQDDIKGEFSGVGMEITNRDGLLTVVSPLPESPAFRADIRAKDIISEIEGKDSLEMSSYAAVKLIRGEKGTKVKLQILRKGNTEPLEIEIIRDLIKIPVVKTYQKDGVFVIKIYSFTENSPQKFIAGIQDFIESKKQKLIIDLRGNSGGHLFAVTYILGMFLEKDKIILTENYGNNNSNKKENKILKSGDYHQNDNLINIFNDNLQLGILVDSGSASASEILAGVLLDYQKTILFGTNTFGKGTVQELIQLENKAALKVTVAKWILPKGSWITKEGISPDVEIEISEEELKKRFQDGVFQAKIDPQLETAIKYLAKYKNKNDYQEALQEFSEKRLKKEEIEKEEKLKKIRENLRENKK